MERSEVLVANWHFSLLHVPQMLNCKLLHESTNWQLLLQGGRDKRGGPILTFPSATHPEKLKYDDLRRLMTYLASVPRYWFPAHFTTQFLWWFCHLNLIITITAICTLGDLNMYLKFWQITFLKNLSFECMHRTNSSHVDARVGL